MRDTRERGVKKKEAFVSKKKKNLINNDKLTPTWLVVYVFKILTCDNFIQI